jgi:hypothetical protein
MSQCNGVWVECNIILVNRIPFLLTIPRLIYFGTAEAILNQEQKTLLIQGVECIHKYPPIVWLLDESSPHELSIRASLWASC